MSYIDGLAAMNLEMPARIPRTEFSADSHWSLVQAVTGINVGAHSPRHLQNEAGRAFIRQWNYDFIWRILIHRQPLKGFHTNMGHAVYAADGVDYDDKLFQAISDPEAVLAFDPEQQYGLPDHQSLVREFECDYSAATAQNPDSVNMTGIYITFISGFIEIFGWEMLLMAMGLDSVRFGEMANRYKNWMQHYFNALADADIPFVMVHDDIAWTSGAFLDPTWYREFVFPAYRQFLAPLVESGKKIMFTSDGNFTTFIDDIVACGVHGFVMEPHTDMRYIAERYGKSHVFVGNADTRVLLHGNKVQIREEVRRCMDIGRNCPGFFMAVGNHIPPNTPIENALYYNEVYEELSRR